MKIANSQHEILGQELRDGPIHVKTNQACLLKYMYNTAWMKGTLKWCLHKSRPRSASFLSSPPWLIYAGFSTVKQYCCNLKNHIQFVYRYVWCSSSFYVFICSFLCSFPINIWWNTSSVFKPQYVSTHWMKVISTTFGIKQGV